MTYSITLDKMDKLFNKIAGRRNAIMYVTEYTLSHMPIEFICECRIRNISIEIVNRSDKRKNTLVQKEDK